MPIPKNAGLSHLADVAEQARRDGLQILHSYPIKKKWQPRQLNPNLAGIEWLESHANGFDDDTEIQYVEQVSDEDPELLIQYSYGREKMTYSRPMFQIIRRDDFSGSRLSVTPCPCDRFEKSWDACRCETHTELLWDHERKAWKRPVADTETVSLATFDPWTGGIDLSEYLSDIAQASLAAERERVSRLIEGLPPASLTGIFELEVSGETVQGAQSFTIEVAPNDR